MAFAEDLLDQADKLAGPNPLAGTQADLRRAVSAAYYAVFHLLVADCVERISPKSPQNLSHKIARAFAHSEMRQVCRSVASKQLSQVFQEILPVGFSPEMRFIAKAFIDLQAERHAADYDFSEIYEHEEVIDLIATARAAFTTWQTIRTTDEANVFLAALLFGARWSK